MEKAAGGAAAAVNLKKCWWCVMGKATRGAATTVNPKQCWCGMGKAGKGIADAANLDNAGGLTCRQDVLQGALG